MINSATRSTIQTKPNYRAMSAGNPRYTDMELISTTLVGSAGVASITFDVSSLTSSYKHLQLRVVGKGLTVIDARINNDSTAGNYNGHYLQGTGTSVVSGVSVGTGALRVGTLNIDTDPGYAASICDILDAFSTTKNKTFRTLEGRPGTSQYVMLRSSVWFSTSAITTMLLSPSSGGNFLAGSRFSLYGIKG